MDVRPIIAVAGRQGWFIRGIRLPEPQDCGIVQARKLLTLFCRFINLFAWGFPRIRGTFGGPHNKDYSIWGSF